MRIKLRRFGEGFTSNPTVVDVEFRKRVHPYRRGEHSAAYDVVIDGDIKGMIFRTMSNTDRIYNRLRVPGKGRPMWGWKDHATERENPIGLYCHNRAYAVAQLLGYDDGEEMRS